MRCDVDKSADMTYSTPEPLLLVEIIKQLKWSSLEIRHFEKNLKLKEMQNSRGKIPKLKEKTQGFGKFYSKKVENRCQNEFMGA